MLAAATDDLMENVPHDEKDVPRVSPGAVDCSLAVTNNSPVCLVALFPSSPFVSRFSETMCRLPSAEQF